MGTMICRSFHNVMDQLLNNNKKPAFYPVCTQRWRNLTSSSGPLKRPATYWESGLPNRYRGSWRGARGPKQFSNNCRKPKRVALQHNRPLLLLSVWAVRGFRAVWLYEAGTQTVTSWRKRWRNDAAPVGLWAVWKEPELNRRTGSEPEKL